MSHNTASVLRLALWLAFLGLLVVLTNCTVYPRTRAGHTSQYGNATVPARHKENRHF